MQGSQKRKILTERLIILILLVSIGVTYHFLGKVSLNP